LGEGVSGGEGHLLSAAIVFSPAGDLCGLWRRPSCFCPRAGRHRSRELPRRSNDSVASTRWGRPRVGRERRRVASGARLSAGRSRGRVSRKRAGRRDKSRTLGNHRWSSTKLAQLFDGDAACGAGATWPRRPAKLDRAVPLSNPPLQRPKPRKSSQNLEAQQGSGRRCIIDQQFTASPLNGRSLDNRGRDLGWMGFWLRRPPALGRNLVVARRRFPRSVAAAGLVLRQRRWASIAGIAAKEPPAPPRHSRWGKPARWLRPAQPCIGDRLSAGRSRGRVSAEARWPARQSRTWATINGPRRTRPALRR